MNTPQFFQLLSACLLLGNLTTAQDLEPTHYLLNSATPLTSGAFGTEAAAIGDLDRDGFEDYAVSAPSFDFGSGPFGRVYVYSGRTSALLQTFDGDQSSSGFGLSLVGVGDVDADGFIDVCVGAPNYSVTGIGNNAGRVWCFSGATGAVIWLSDGNQLNANYGQAIAVIGASASLPASSIIVGQPGYTGNLSDQGRVIYLDALDGLFQADERGVIVFDSMGETLAARASATGLYAGSVGGRVWELNGPFAGSSTPTLLLPPSPGGNGAPLIEHLIGNSVATTGLVVARRFHDSNGFINNGRVSFYPSGTTVETFFFAGSYQIASVGLDLCVVRDFDGDGIEDIGFTSATTTHPTNLRFRIYSLTSTLLHDRIAVGAAGSKFRALQDVTGDGRGDYVQATANSLSLDFSARMFSQGLALNSVTSLSNGALHYQYDIDLADTNATSGYIQLYGISGAHQGFVYNSGAPYVPIVIDAITNIIFDLSGSVLYPDAISTLDATGRAQTNAFVEPFVAANFSGLTITSAVLVFGPGVVTATTNPVTITLP